MALAANVHNVGVQNPEPLLCRGWLLDPAFCLHLFIAALWVLTGLDHL